MAELLLTPALLAEMVGLIDGDTISGKIAKQILPDLFAVSASSALDSGGLPSGHVGMSGQGSDLPCQGRQKRLLHRLVQSSCHLHPPDANDVCEQVSEPKIRKPA
jgi:hypothetical protein